MSPKLPIVCLMLLVLAGCGDKPGAAVSPASNTGPGWERIAAAPLSARRSAHAFEMGDRVLVLGGTEADPCPPNAGCIEPKEAPHRDGAFYDPETDTWETIAEAPVPLGFATGAVLGDKLYLLVFKAGSSNPELENAFLSYDAASDRWTRLELPPVDMFPSLVAAGDEVVAFQTTQENGVRPDLSFDPEKSKWSKLPSDPLQPSFDRSMVWTEEGLVLLGIENVPNPGAEEPAVYRAAVLRGNDWERLPDSEIIGWDPGGWTWSGRYVINASLESADGGETGNWGRVFPAGGMLDPTSGEWADLPGTPQPERDWDLYASSERGMVRGGGWALDAQEMNWLKVPDLPDRPDDESAAAWVADTLVVWGGARYDDGGSLVGDGWLWTPSW